MDEVDTIASMMADGFDVEKFNAEVGDDGFMDWFCPDSSLKRRPAFLLGCTKSMLEKH